MQPEYLISLNEFCYNHNIEISFLSELQHYELVEITTIDGNRFIDLEQMSQLEKIVRLHYELEINLEDIVTIKYLLQRINSMQEEIIALRNKLRLYETEL